MSFVGVCVCGKAGSGKNEFARTFADALAERGGWAAEINFADALKQELWEVYGLTKQSSNGRSKLIELGQSRREENPEYWIDRLAERIAHAAPYGITPVITDCRYVNELAWAKRNNFVTIRIDASATDRALVMHARGEDPGFVYSEHASECELDEADYHLRFTNPHSDRFALVRAAYWALDLLLEDAETVGSLSDAVVLGPEDQLPKLPNLGSKLVGSFAKVRNLLDLSVKHGSG